MNSPISINQSAGRLVHRLVLIGLLAAGLSASAQRVTTAPPPHLAILYPNPGFTGTPVYFDQTGTWASGSNNWTALAACTNGSLQLAAGYRLRLMINARNFAMIKPEDDADLSNDQIKTISQVTVEPTPPPPPRARVLLALTGNNLLVNATNDPQWIYVRQNTDGIWFNAAGIGWADISNIVSKVQNQVCVNEQDSMTNSLSQWGLLSNLAPNNLLNRYPNFNLTFEGTCLFKGYGNGDAVTNWNYGEVDYARSIYTDVTPTPPTLPVQKIYTGWEPWPFEAAPSAGKSLLTNGYALHEFNAGDGAFMECGPGLFMGGNGFHYAVTNCIRLLHASGKPFFWFMSHNGGTNTPDPNFVQTVKNAYYILEADGLIQTNDAYFVVNYGGSMQIVPEVDPVANETPPTMTGIMYWLLHQGHNLVIDSVGTEPLKWATSGSGTWDTSALNWKDSSTPTPGTYAYVDGDTVVFDDTYLSGDTAVTLNTTVNPASVTANNSTYNYTITGSGAIAGTNSLVKSGSKPLTLATANTYTGGTTVNNGTVALSGSGTLGAATGALTMSGGTLDLGGNIETNGAVSITAAAGSGNTIQNGSLKGSSYAASLVSGNAIVSANLLGTNASLTKTGAGTLTLAGTVNLAPSLLTVSSGTVIITNRGAVTVGTGTGQGVAGGAELDINGGSLTTAFYISIGTSAGIGTFTLNSGAFTNTGEFLISFTGGDGVANINGGHAELNLFSMGSVSAKNATMNLNGGTVRLAKFNARNTNANNVINFNGSTVVAKSGQPDFIETNTILTANVLAGGIIINMNGFNLTNNAPLLHAASLGATLDGGLTTLGTGTLKLTGASTYTGNTTVNGGTLAIGQATLATNSTVTVSNGCVLELDFAVTNLVTQLVLNGVSVTGVHNHDTDPIFITGIGSLLVPSSYASNPTNISFNVSGNSLNLIWPGDHKGWLVQSNSLDLSNTNDWHDIAGTDAGTNYSITMNPGQTNVFYRLRKP